MAAAQIYAELQRLSGFPNLDSKMDEQKSTDVSGSFLRWYDFITI